MHGRMEQRQDEPMQQHDNPTTRHGEMARGQDNTARSFGNMEKATLRKQREGGQHQEGKSAGYERVQLQWRWNQGGGPTYDRVFIRVMPKLKNTTFIPIIQYNCLVIFYIHIISILNTVIIIR